MYSGSTLTRYSGRVLGAHQKIDRVARHHIAKVLSNDDVFPKAMRILHFEGKNGPDGIKRKSPAKDEPWHYFNPFDDEDTQLINLLQQHYDQLVKEIKNGNQERIAFEAAWLAHGIVDGLTPAHHYPYEEKLTELRGGEGIETRTTLKAKVVMPGETLPKKMKNNWKMWGPKGLLSTHGMFEFGIATLIAPLGFGEVIPTKKVVSQYREKGFIGWFKHAAREIAIHDMYQNYYRKGWTPRLANQVRHKLGPTIVQTVSLTWLSALIDAGVVKEEDIARNRR